MKRARHLEVMVGGCDGSEFAVIREFFEQRGYGLTESRKGDVYRLWAQRAKPLYAVDGQRGARPQGERALMGLSADELRLAGSMKTCK